MPREPMIHDTPEFRAMWFSPMPVWEIADHYGVTRPAVSLAAMRFGLPKRKPGRRAHRIARLEEFAMVADTRPEAGAMGGYCESVDAAQPADQQAGGGYIPAAPGNGVKA